MDRLGMNGQKKASWLVSKDKDKEEEMLREARIECYSEPGFDSRKELNKSLMTNPFITELLGDGDGDDNRVLNRSYGEKGPQQLFESMIIFPAGQETDLMGSRMNISYLEQSVISTYESKFKLGHMHYFELSKLRSSSQAADLMKRLSPSASWVDPNFKHSLASVEGSFPDRLKVDAASITWVRVNEMSVFKRDHPRLFGDDPKTEDTGQGSLGNCYFIASMASMAAIPARITRLFASESQIANGQGVYSVFLCINGFWQEVLVDDYFPSIDRKSPLFAKCPTLKIWAMVLEKAYAKTMNGYLNLVSGAPTEALSVLSGAPTHTYRVTEEEVDKVISQVSDFLSKKYPMTTCSGKTAAVSEGIEKNHAYSVIAIYFLKSAGAPDLFELQSERNEETSEVLFKLRNPWCSRDKWTGKWSRNDSIRNKNHRLMEKIIKDYELGAETGILLVSRQDFFKSFVNFSICEYMDDAVFSSMQIKQSSNINIYDFSVSPGCGNKPLSIGFVQLNPRMHGFQLDENLEFAKVSMLVCKKEADGLRYLKGVARSYHMMHKSVTLSEGDYSIVFAPNWNSNSTQGVLTFYGSEKIQLKEAKLTEDQLVLHLEQMFKKMLEEPTHKKKFNTFPNHALLKTFRYIEKTMDQGYTVFYFVNDHPSRCVIVYLKLLEVEGLSFIQPAFRSITDQLSLAVDPGTTKIVIMRHTDGRVLIKYKLSFEA